MQKYCFTHAYVQLPEHSRPLTAPSCTFEEDLHFNIICMNLGCSNAAPGGCEGCTAWPSGDTYLNYEYAGAYRPEYICVCRRVRLGANFPVEDLSSCKFYLSSRIRLALSLLRKSQMSPINTPA